MEYCCSTILDFVKKCGVQKFSGHIKWKFISKVKDKKMEDKFFWQVGVRHLYPMRSPKHWLPGDPWGAKTVFNFYATHMECHNFMLYFH